MSSIPPRPFPEARLLAPEDPAPIGATVWVYDGMLERFIGAQSRLGYHQRIAWPAGAPWADIRDLGLWMVERLSINGHLLIGLRARLEGTSPDEARAISPEA